MPKNAYFIAKFLKFADGDAEAPLSVFLFHYKYHFKEAEEFFCVLRLDFCYAKIIIIPLIYNIFALIIYKKKHFFYPKGSMMERLVDFASSAPEFRRVSKGNIRHRLSDIIVLTILARASKCLGRAEIIAFGKHNLGRFRSMGMLRNGVPFESTLCRVEQGMDELALAERMTELMETFRGEASCNGEADIVCVDGKAMRGTTQGNGRNPDMVSAYSCSAGITLATEMCGEKSNEITAVPALLDKLDIPGAIVTADAMSMQKAVIDKIRERSADFVIELKANQRSLRYGVEDSIKTHTPVRVHTEGPVLEHGRIETREYRAYDGHGIIADRDRWGGNLTVVEFLSETVRKSTGDRTSERRLYVSSLPPNAARLGSVIRKHWSIESMHWSLDCHLKQDGIKRKTTRSARNLDTLQRVVHALFSTWRRRRKKRADKARGTAELMRAISVSFTNLMRFMNQK